jgi:hypothetical protein
MMRSWAENECMRINRGEENEKKQDREGIGYKRMDYSSKM